MKFHIRFINGECGEYEGTQADIDRGFADGRFKFVRYGTIEYIPVGAVLAIYVPEASTVERGYTRK